MKSQTALVTATRQATVRGRCVGVLTLTTTLLSLSCGNTTAPAAGPSVSSVEIMPEADTLRTIGRTLQLVALVRGPGGDPLPNAPVEWSSSNPRVVVVDATGLVTAVGEGGSTISASAAGIVGSSSAVVEPTTASLALSLPPDTLRAFGDTARAGLTASDSSGTAISNPAVVWQSSDSGVVTVSSGLVTAISNGVATLTVTEGSLRDSVSVVVHQRADADRSIVVATRRLMLPLDTVEVRLEARDSRGNPMERGGATVSFSAAQATGTGSFLEVVDRGDGTYTALFVAQQMGPEGEFRATIDGEAAAGQPDFRVVGFTRIAAAGSTWIGMTTAGVTCGLITTGDMYCWGAGPMGVLGIGTITHANEPHPVPQLVSGGHQWIDVALGSYFGCGVTTEARVYCWGDGDVGQIGNGRYGNPPDVLTPTPILSDSLFRSVHAAQSSGACALTPGGTAVCWGGNTSGRLGNGSETLSAIPVAVHGGLSFEALTTSPYGTCGIASGGAAYCWGSYFTAGAVAPDVCAFDVPCAKEPVAVRGGISFEPVIAMNGNVVCAVAASGTYCWGSGFLGDGPRRFRSSPTLVSGGLEFIELSGGDGYHCGITAGRAAYCWGANRYGRLGSDTGIDENTPVPVVGGLSFTDVATSAVHACAISTEGLAYCWGGNDKGELGDGTLTSSSTPVRVRLF